MTDRIDTTDRVDTPDRIEKTIDLAAPVSRVWRTLTDHEEFGAWFRAELDGPFALGQATRARSTYPGCEDVRWQMVVTRMEPERVFAFTAEVGDLNPDDVRSTDPPTEISFTLEPTATGTRLHLVESGFDKFSPERRRDAWRDNDGGWDLQMANIREHVDGGRG